ncbi:MAG: cysteine hydrolase, partial [Patescibacteria group bacterium]|nr:cysteine hydrolase [Patescibacteria group bacterium]
MQNDFSTWLENWMKNLSNKKLTQLGKPEHIAIVSVDMVVGFCHKGPLASKEVHSIIPNVIDVFTNAHEYGVKHFLLL